MIDDEKPWQLPDKFRASADKADATAFQRLQDNDEQQADLGSRINAPFTTANPRDAHRSKALITIETYKDTANLSDDAQEQLAEAYALIGNYDVAAGLSKQNNDLYQQYWDAVWLDDDKWCDHAAEHKYIKEYVYSIREGREMPLLACNQCHTWNVLDAPTHLVTRESRQSEYAGATKGMTIADAKRWHQQTFRK